MKISARRDLVGYEMELSWRRRFLEAQVVDMAGDFRMSVEIRFHMWRSAENTNAVSEMFFFCIINSLCVMRVVSTHDCMTLWHSYPFFKTLADFFASTKIALIFTSYDGTFGLSSSWWWMLVDFFSTDIFHQFGRVKSLQVVGAWLDFIPKTSPASPKKTIWRPFFMTIFTNIPFGRRNNHKKSSIQGNHLESLKPTMYKWSAINWMMISHLCIGNLRTKKFTKLPGSVPGRRTDWDFRCSRAGQGFQVWSRYGNPLRWPLAAPGHGDVMKVGTLADSGAEARKFNLDLEMGCWMDFQMGCSVVQKGLTQP